MVFGKIYYRIESSRLANAILTIVGMKIYYRIESSITINYYGGSLNLWEDLL